MNEYRFLRKCRGTCEKRKNVSETNCIGINPQHSDCKYSRMKRFRDGFCPYYCPIANEKNYNNNLEDIEGIQYMRQPFQVLWYPVIFVLATTFIFSLTLGKWSIIFSFFKTNIIICIFVFIICSFLNHLYVKFKGNKFVAVVNDDGIYTPRLFLSWDKIKKVKTHYNLPSKRHDTSYIVELELIMNIDEEVRYTESVYIYFSTLKMRQHIKRYKKHHIS